ncbi:hypothetical protein L6452_31104 [Arctium lappa]|uniref:Uncharacterized protein n=1 Tax=Arctium lappa TaxID=4217 RepID=A0ACB8ZL02_ARCLA|nr:hypothetical protein L6452_31104 [Arctium lappa]
MSLSTRCIVCLYKNKRVVPSDVYFNAYSQDSTHVQRVGIIFDVFGEKNLERWIVTIDPSDLPTLLDTLEQKARARLEDPIRGSSGQVMRLAEENQKLRNELEGITAENVTLRENLAKQRQEHHEHV